MSWSPLFWDVGFKITIETQQEE
uniref:Uncharacterized protein n=1 Tax=Physcomitrium patens TaxID=3218 RepID=A0A2K1JXR3_PHYPA|nr:hypothetical protein PHYPA_013437 [Physcomitrium patens]